MACELYLNKAVIFLKTIKEPQIEIGNWLWVPAKPPKMNSYCPPLISYIPVPTTLDMPVIILTPLWTPLSCLSRFFFMVKTLLGTSSAMSHFLESRIPSSRCFVVSRPSQSCSLVLTICLPRFKVYLATGLLIQRKSHVKDKYMKESQGLPWWLSGSESACQCRGHRFDPWFKKIPYAVEQLSQCSAIREATTMRSLHTALQKCT